MTTLGSMRTQYDALLTALQATGQRVGLAQVPADHSLPYAVLYPAEGPLDGPVGDPFADSVLQPQLTYISDDPNGAMWLADHLRPLVFGLTQLGAGRSVMQVQLEVSRPVARDDDLKTAKPLFYVVDVFRVPTTPA